MYDQDDNDESNDAQRRPQIAETAWGVFFDQMFTTSALWPNANQPLIYKNWFLPTQQLKQPFDLTLAAAFTGRQCLQNFRCN